MKKIICSSILIFLLSPFSFAQPSVGKLQSNISKNSSLQKDIQFKSTSPVQAGILFGNSFDLPETTAVTWIEQQLETRAGIDELRAEDADTKTTDNIRVKKLRQFYRNIKVEHGIISMASQNGKMKMMQFEFYSIDNDFSIQPLLTTAQALQKALLSAPASVYEWADSAHALLSPGAPQGELVIVRDYETGNAVCLAYKFDITTLQPFSSAFIYVNAHDGRIILNNPQVKHTSRSRNAGGINGQDIKAKTAGWHFNKTISKKGQERLVDYGVIPGAADTRFNGLQTILTDNNSGIAGKPYRLRSKRNGVNIETYNMEQYPYNSPSDYYSIARDFVDNDNNWSASEFNNANYDNTALDVQFAMQIISDYWWQVHQRRGWDNANSPIKSYVHAAEIKKVNGVYGSYFLQNAMWWKKRMTFGDGEPASSIAPYTSLDISAHEMGHAITETTCDLVYQWESGAMNESFSDIWAACITDFALPNYNLTNESTWRVGEKTKPNNFPPGIRDLSNPGLYNDPSAYKGQHWQPASLPTCRDFENQDNCGVHTNSGVLNKWFFLITQGQQGINYFGTPFNVSGLGFATSEKIAYLTELNLTPNATYQTCRTVSLNATATLFGNTSQEFQTVWNAWVAVAVDSNVFNMANTPVFTTNNFTSIAVGRNGVVMAGTNYAGAYKFENNAWSKMSDLQDVRFNDIKADYYGNFWMAQSGRSGTVGGGSSIGGGVSHYAFPFTNPNTLYTIGAQTDVPSRNARCIYIDTFRNINIISPSVWMAATSYITSSNSTSGMLGHGVNATAPAFTNVSAGINIGSGTAGCLTMGGNKDVIWTFVQANNGINQLLTYNAVTNALIETFDHNSHPVIPSGFVARSIYCDAKKRTWIGLAAGGILVYDESKNWHYLSPANYPQLFPPGTQASFNAIAGTKDGDIYFGTTNGLVFFERGDGIPDKIEQAGSYRSYGKANGLPSNVINAIAYDTLRFKVLVATDSGIVFWEPLCISPYCNNYKFAADKSSETTGPGSWSNPATWSTGSVPDSATDVTIKHNITVDIDGECNTLNVSPAVNFTIQTGKKLTIYTKGAETIYTGTEQRRRRR